MVEHVSVDDEGRRFETDVRIDGVFEDHVTLDSMSQLLVCLFIALQER